MCNDEEGIVCTYIRLSNYQKLKALILRENKSYETTKAKI
jgi:hypothetical protein